MLKPFIARSNYFLRGAGEYRTDLYLIHAVSMSDALGLALEAVPCTTAECWKLEEVPADEVRAIRLGGTCFSE